MLLSQVLTYQSAWKNQIGKYGSFDDVDNDTLENFVYSQHDDLKERGPDL